MKRKLFFLLTLAISFSFALSADASPVARLVCGTSSNTGTYYMYGGNWAKVMNTKVDGVDIACEVSGGPTKNLQLLALGDIDLGFTTGWMAGEAFNGIGEFEGKPTRNSRALFPMYTSIMYLYALESSPVNSLQDLEGKHVATGSPGGTSDKAARAMMSALGIKPARVSSLTGETLSNAVKDGIVDAAFYVGSAPASVLLNIETTHKIKFIEFKKEEFENIFKSFPFWNSDVVPAGTYKTQTKDFEFISFWNYAVAREDLDEELVYKLVKTTMENHDSFIKTDKNFTTTIPNNVKKIVTTLHPGAYRYYKEIGIEVPENIVPK